MTNTRFWVLVFCWIAPFVISATKWNEFLQLEDLKSRRATAIEQLQIQERAMEFLTINPPPPLKPHAFDGTPMTQL